MVDGGWAEGIEEATIGTDTFSREPAKEFGRVELLECRGSESKCWCCHRVYICCLVRL